MEGRPRVSGSLTMTFQLQLTARLDLRTTLAWYPNPIHQQSRHEAAVLLNKPKTRSQEREISTAARRTSDGLFKCPQSSITKSQL